MKIIENFIFQTLVNNDTEGFINMDEDNSSINKLPAFKKLGRYQHIAFIASLIITNLVLLFFGKYIWNNYLTKAIKTVNPLDNIWELLAISILIKLMIN